MGAVSPTGWKNSWLPENFPLSIPSLAQICPFKPQAGHSLAVKLTASMAVTMWIPWSMHTVSSDLCDCVGRASWCDNCPLFYLSGC